MAAQPEPQGPTPEQVEPAQRADPIRSVRIRWPDDPGLEAKYANQAQVTIGPTEVVLLFAQVLPPVQRPGEGLPKSIAEGYIDARPVVQIVMTVEGFLPLAAAVRQQAERLERLISEATESEEKGEGERNAG